MSVARNVICWRRLTNCFRQIRRAVTVVDGVDEAAQLELVADRQPMQLDQGRRDMVGATQAEHQNDTAQGRQLFPSDFATRDILVKP